MSTKMDMGEDRENKYMPYTVGYREWLPRQGVK